MLLSSSSVIRRATLRNDCTRHIHLSHRDAWELENDGVIEWVHRPVNRRDIGIVRISLTFVVRGLSCRVGEELAVALLRRCSWTRAMFADYRAPPALKGAEVAYLEAWWAPSAYLQDPGTNPHIDWFGT
jgi:hypothetical protein